jgi:hypothetical protein
MKKIVLFVFLVSISHIAHNQVVRGTIFDKSDNSKVNFASIYFNGTSVGTNSDQNGYFELDISKSHSQPLTVSALGYYSVSLTDYLKDKPLAVYLTPKVFEMKQVVIKAKSLAKERKGNLKLFRNEFLGISDNAQRCTIINLKDIRFNYGTSDDTLKAFASNPLLIFNNGLGYRITYYLDRFEFYKKSNSYLIQGTALFNEDLASTGSKKKFFETRRKYAFQGSRSHFFSSLWANDLKSGGFNIWNSANENLKYFDIVFAKDSLTKYLVYDGKIKILSRVPGKASNLKSDNNLKISYLSTTPNSYIEFLKDTVSFESNGYFDGSGIRILGQMAVKRIGDLLPYDYRLK